MLRTSYQFKSKLELRKATPAETEVKRGWY